MVKAAAIMLQGTGSDVGKSLVAAGLCRLFAERGLAVRPFKPQNMSNNAAVTLDGGEIGRAQALQAKACRTSPLNDMNPVLLKPQGERMAQMVVQGRAAGTASAADYRTVRAGLMPRVLESFARLEETAELVVAEGAGSPAEANLRENDIANMGFAEAADLPVILVADIDRGGVLASLVGTHALLSQSERARVKGYIVNKFRGDPSLFAPAIDIVQRHTNWPCLGVLPWFEDAKRLPAEDGMALPSRSETRATHAEANDNRHKTVRIAAPLWPRVGNFDDLDPLAAEPNVRLTIVTPGEPLPPADLVLLPGSKATRADLQTLYESGWDADIAAHLERGGKVFGVCGGYQMLGRVVRDPLGLEGPPGETPGLGLLDIDTEMTATKILRHVGGSHVASGQPIAGFEMHMGVSDGPGRDRPFAIIGNEAEGARSQDGRIAGSYLHGLFGADAFRRAFLAELGVESRLANYDALIEATLDKLARHVADHIDIERILEFAGERRE
jgi:adenosylcobyric acid synthase